MYSYTELTDMLNTDKPIERCEDCEIIAQMVRPIDPPEGKTNTFPSGDKAYWYTCKHLLENNDCEIYDNRPRMCKDYPYGKKCHYEGCTYTGVGTPYPDFSEKLDKQKEEEEEENTNVSESPALLS